MQAFCISSKSTPVREVALLNAPSQVNVTNGPKLYLLLHFSLSRSQMGVVCHKGETKECLSQGSQSGVTLSDGLLL